MAAKKQRSASDWTVDENEAIVDSYLAMLAREQASVRFNKAEQNRLLGRRLPGRTRGAIEFKHCNISAVLAQEGHPFIRGYQPRRNYQEDLRTVVLRKLRDHRLPTRSDGR
jgi:hypothetical protein